MDYSTRGRGVIARAVLERAGLLTGGHSALWFAKIQNGCEIK